MSIDRHNEFARTTMPTAKELFGNEKPSEIELGLLQMEILWLLSRKSTHGYDLMKDLSNMRGKKITQGTLYPTLQRLEELGFIEGRAEENRVVYKITPEGSKMLHDTCTDFVKTFFGIFHDFACTKCMGHAHAKPEKK